MITKFICFINENINQEEKLVRTLSWLHILLVYENTGGVEEKD